MASAAGDPEGKYRHEQVMYFDKCCLRIYDFPQTHHLARSAGSLHRRRASCSPPCATRIVAADDAVFQNRRCA